MFMDTFFTSVKSIRGYKCAQLLVSDYGYIGILPMESRKDIHLALKQFFKDRGVPHVLVCYRIAEQIGGKTRASCNQSGCTVKALEKNTPWSNRAELYIGLVKKEILRELKRSDAPMKLWCYLAQRMEKVHNVLARDISILQGETPFFKATGLTPDISHLCEFGWY